MAYTTQYIGSRYVPMFADPAEWNSTRTYEPLTIVLHEGNSYTSRQFVPVGIDIGNADFWLETGNYNAQVEQYREEVKAVKNAVISFESLEDVRMNAANLNYGQTILIDGRLYIISTATANEMDIVFIKNGYTASLIFNKFLSPEDLFFNKSVNDASPYIQRCIDICRNNATVVLSNVYPIKNTIHMSYEDNIYIVGTAALETSVSPAISFDVNHLITDKRMRKPFNGNNLRIYSYDRQLHNNPDYIGVLITNAEEIEISNLNIYYMGTAIKIDSNNNYCITFTHCLIERNYYGILYNADTNSGEKIAFNDCIFGHEYVCFYSNTNTLSTLSFNNTSFDFCNCGFYEANNAASNAIVSFINCHIEGLGYYGSDMPRINNNYYANFIFCENTKWTIHRFNFTGCMVHVSKMQDELGLPLLVNDTTSKTNIESCTLSSKTTKEIAIYPISNGFCNKGFHGNGNYFYVGSKMLPINMINGPYVTLTKDMFKAEHRNNLSNIDNELINYIYIALPQTSQFVIDTEFNESNINYNNIYSDNINGLHFISLNNNAIAAKVNLGSNNSSVIINGIYPLS